MKPEEGREEAKELAEPLLTIMKATLQGYKFVRWPLEKCASLADATDIHVLTSTETQMHFLGTGAGPAEPTPASDREGVASTSTTYTFLPSFIRDLCEHQFERDHPSNAGRRRRA
eukprot:2747785-Pleurochrysis_carterae.AAC.1